MGAHHKFSDSGSGLKRNSYDPHAGPLVGDACYRQHFATPEEFKAAMRLAAQLESRGLHRRAWRVRWNLDGDQPARVALPPANIETEDGRRGRPVSADVVGVAEMVEETGLSNYLLGRALGVSHHSVERWRKGGRITPEAYAKLKEFCK